MPKPSRKPIGKSAPSGNTWARSYRRLAQQAERNSQTDVTYETPPQRPAAAPPAQQQQQQQPKAKGESEIETRPENDR